MSIRGRQAGKADEDDEDASEAKVEDVRRQMTRPHCALCQNSNDFALSKLKFLENEINIVGYKWNILKYNKGMCMEYTKVQV